MADSQKVTDVKTKKLDMSQRSYITYHIISHTFFVAERMILVVSLNYQTFFAGDDIKAPIQNYKFVEKNKQPPQNLSLSTIVQTPLQSAGWQMVTLSTCN